MRRLAIPAALLALALPTAAAAKGGGDPAPYTGPITACDFAVDGLKADGGFVFSNQVAEAGCISVIQRDMTLRLYKIDLSPGWSYTVKSNGEGTNSRVQVDFTNGSLKREARIEFGKTVVR